MSFTGFMSKQKKPPQKDPQQKPKKAAKPPMLEEKQSFFAKLQNRGKKIMSGKTAARLLPPGAQQVKNDLIGFGKIAVFVVPGIIVLSGALVGTDMLLHGRIMPGTSMAGQQVGFLYNGEAFDILQQTVDKYLKTPLTVTVNGTQTQITPADLGVQFSLQQTLLSIPTYDLRKNSLLTLAFAAISQHQAAPFMTLDSDQAQDAVEQKLGLQKFRAQDARIGLDDQKNPTVIAESDGEVIDKDELVSQLKLSMKNLQPVEIKLNLIAEKPSITAQDLQSQKDVAVNTLKTPITLMYNDQKWKFDPSKHLDAVAFVQNPTVTIKNIHLILPVVLNGDQSFQSNDNVTLNSTPVMTLDAQKIKDFLQTQIIAQIDRPTSDVKIYTDANKKIVIDGKGENGIKVSPDGLLASLDFAIGNNIPRLQVPAEETKANVTVSPDLQNLGIKNLVSTGRTVFAGSHPGRIVNINVGMSRYNGLLIKPGEVFSFDDHLGPVDGQHGYVEELVIKGNQGTVPDFGGGLCQVSSTIYQAALLAGFPILERANHSYAVSYYAKPLGYGLDATIYPGVHDVKFKNDSPAAILIQSYTENGQAYFKFYGTDDGRKVWLEGPYQGNYRAAAAPQTVTTNTLAPGVKKQVEIPHTGFDVTWYRHILQDGKETKEKLFTRYDNTGAEILVGAGTPSGTADTASVPKT